MNELITFIAQELQKQKGDSWIERHGICRQLTMAYRTKFFSEDSIMAIVNAVNALPKIDLAGYCFPLTDEGDLQRIEWLESLKQ